MDIAQEIKQAAKETYEALYGSNNTNNNLDSDIRSNDMARNKAWEQKRGRLMRIRENDSQEYNKKVLEELKGSVR